jgi:hypothetical protein
MNQAKPPQAKNKAAKPATNEVNGFKGMANATIKATIAIAHQGRYKQAAMLSKAVSIKTDKNFILIFCSLIEN